MSREDADQIAISHREWAEKLARSVARKLFAMDSDEAAGEGLLALVRAARRWNPSSGAPFKSFAQRRIVGAVIDIHRKNDPAGRWMRKKINSGQQIGRGVPYQVYGDVRDLDQRRAIVVPVPATQEVLAELRDVARQIAAFPPRMREIARRHALESEGLASIGRDMGVSEARICQIWREAQRRLIAWRSGRPLDVAA